MEVPSVDDINAFQRKVIIICAV